MLTTDMKIHSKNLKTFSPDAPAHRAFNSASEAVSALQSLYDLGTAYLRERFTETLNGQQVTGRYRAYYPETVSYTHLTLPTKA